ncbi:hypothetical protein J4225_04320 [Candidatus Pacearchaeota archaeon]|nr:hypothetical protein [Candidatus Pacearchaeota archaeon]
MDEPDADKCISYKGNGCKFGVCDSYGARMNNGTSSLCPHYFPDGAIWRKDLMLPDYFENRLEDQRKKELAEIVAGQFIIR